MTPLPSQPGRSNKNWQVAPDKANAILADMQLAKREEDVNKQ
jgi:hypothetical protein